MKTALWRMVSKTIAGAALIAGSTMATADLLNPGFETGTFYGWSTGGTGSAAVISTAGSSLLPTAGTDSWTGPYSGGSFMAGLFTGSVLEFLAQPSPASLTPMTLWLNLITTEYGLVGFNDFVQASVQTTSGLLNYSLTALGTSFITGHTLRSSGWNTFLLPAGTTGVTITLTNAGDTLFPSYAFVDITPAIPEPEVYLMMLAGLGLMGWVARRRREALEPEPA